MPPYRRALEVLAKAAPAPAREPVPHDRTVPAPISVRPLKGVLT